MEENDLEVDMLDFGKLLFYKIWRFVKKNFQNVTRGKVMIQNLTKRRKFDS